MSIRLHTRGVKPLRPRGARCTACCACMLYCKMAVESRSDAAPSRAHMGAVGYWSRARHGGTAARVDSGGTR